MSRQVTTVGTLTIANGTATSNALVVSKTAFHMAIDYVIYTDTATPTNTVTLQVAPGDNPSAGDWRPAYRDGATITLPANSAIAVPVAAFRSIRAVSAGNEGAPRVYTVVCQIDTD